jgi:hypothetical protein
MVICTIFRQITVDRHQAFSLLLNATYAPFFSKTICDRTLQARIVKLSLNEQVWNIIIGFDNMYIFSTRIIFHMVFTRVGLRTCCQN